MLKNSFLTFFTSCSQANRTFDLTSLGRRPGSVLSASSSLYSRCISSFTGYLLTIISRIRQCWRATGAAVNCVGRKGGTNFVFCCLPILFLIGCDLPNQPVEPNIPAEPNIVEPNEPNEPCPTVKQAWTDFDGQWVIRLNGKTYLHQMRKRKNGRGVECQFVLISASSQIYPWSSPYIEKMFKDTGERYTYEKSLRYPISKQLRSLSPGGE